MSVSVLSYKGITLIQQLTSTDMSLLDELKETELVKVEK